MWQRQTNSTVFLVGMFLVSTIIVGGFMSLLQSHSQNDHDSVERAIFDREPAKSELPDNPWGR